MPPRAFIEPDMGRLLSSFIYTLSASSKAPSLSTLTSGDSIIPPDFSVSGKALLMSGAKRKRRSSASAISESRSSQCLSSLSQSFALSSFIQSVSRMFSRSESTFPFIYSFVPKQFAGTAPFPSFITL